MGLFRKEKIPEIPMSPSLPDLPKTELPELPSFPPKNDNINQEIVKSAISDNFGEIEVKADAEEDLGKINLPVVPMTEEQLPPSGRESIMNDEKIPSAPKPEKKIINLSKPKEELPESIFVRIDKFQLAKKNADQIKRKVEEIETVLKKLNQIKAKEEEEIKNWSTEIANLKSKLSEIDSNIFSQI